MLSRLLCCLPASWTGRTDKIARCELRDWTRGNSIRESHKYGAARRRLIEFSGRPVAFAFLVAAFCIALGAIALVPLPDQWREHMPSLSAGFRLNDFVEEPWGVQATLVALVYPIVLSFVALMLQRRIHSTAALRVYILDSAVVPAGASSIGLLLVLGLQYFASPYLSTQSLLKLATPLIVMSGAWMFINILLAGVFIFRTIRFLQKEEEELAFTRVAIDVVLRAQFTTAIQRNFVRSAPQRAWGLPADDVFSESAPQVRMTFSEDGLREVQTRVVSGRVLHDVHLRLLGLVAKSWRRRAVKAHSRAPNGARAPSLVFFANIGSKNSGALTLCEVKDGPRFTWWERALTKASFVYRPSRSSVMFLSIDKMLSEVAGEVAQAAVQSRQVESVERLRDMVALHRSVLQSSADESGARSFSLAMLEPEVVGGRQRTFSEQWLEPYRALNQLAVQRLEDDDRLFRALAYTPTWLSRGMLASPVEPLLEVQQLGSNLVFELSRWWTRKADASMLPGEMNFGGTLPNPANKVYEQAIVQFLGGWGSHWTADPKRLSGDESIVWRGLCGRANVYADHLERSAGMVLQAVSRGDETASIWFTDGYLKWLSSGVRGPGVTRRRDERMLSHTTMGLTDLSWTELQEVLGDGGEPITISVGETALGLALRQYWESMRLYMTFMLMDEAGLQPKGDARELRIASALIAATGLRPGGSVKASSMESVDVVLYRLLSELFGVRSTVRRLDAFADSRSLHERGLMVPGWAYGWSSGPAELEALSAPLLSLLVALCGSAKVAIHVSKRLIESWWRDIDKLSSVRRHLELLLAELRSEDFVLRHPSVATLKAAIERTRVGVAGGPMSVDEFKRRRDSVATALDALIGVAKHERDMTLRVLTVDAAKMREFASAVAVEVFGPSLADYPIEKIEFLTGLTGVEGVALMNMPKRQFLSDREVSPDDGDVRAYAEHLRNLVLQSATQELLKNRSIVELPYPKFIGDEPSVGQRQALLGSFATAIESLKKQGLRPVALVGNTMAALLEPYLWGDGDWAYPLPEGVSLAEAPSEISSTVVSLINDVPVVRFEIFHQAGYVLPESAVKQLQVRAASAADAFVVSWRPLDVEEIEISLKWVSRFGEVEI